MAAAANQQPQYQQRRSPREPRQPISPEAIEEAACKLFIASLPASTTEENLKEYFSKFGEVVEASIARDQHTKESRRFGFITFDNKEAVDKAQAARPHTLDNKQITTKRSIPKGLQQSPDVASTTKTLYVGGLKEDVITEELIKDYFKDFGNIEKIYWSVNKETGTKRPYCFVYFDDSDAVDKIVFSTKHEISGIALNTKKSLRDVENGPQKMMMPPFMNGPYPGNIPPFYGPGGYNNMMPSGGRGGYMYPAPGGGGRGGHFPNMHYFGNGYGPQGNHYGGGPGGMQGGPGGNPNYRQKYNKNHHQQQQQQQQQSPQQQQRPVAKA